MRVWIIEISDFLPEIDGGNRLYRAGMLANALVEKGHYVRWWSSTYNHQRRRQRFSNSRTINIKENYQLRLLYGPGYKRSVSFRRILHNRTVAKAFYKETEKLELRKKPDIIYTCLPTLEVSEQAVNFGLRHNIPVVVDIRELWPDNYLTVFPSPFRSLLRLLLKNEFLRAYKILNNATAITASSQAYVKWGIKTGKRQRFFNDKWFPLGFTPSNENNELSSKENLICLLDGTTLPSDSLLITFVGTFTSHLDYSSLIAVAKEFNDSSNNKVHFLFVGDGDKFKLLRKKSEKLDNVHLTGWCEKHVVNKLLSLSSIGLAPYMMELMPTLPNKPFEYMAAGLPILSSLEGELENILIKESIGFKYRGGDSKDLKQKILWFLSHPAEARAMGQRAKKLFEKKYRADIVYAEFSKYLERIVMDNGKGS